jgi:1,4-alpha-glucan branching enzyme
MILKALCRHSGLIRVIFSLPASALASKIHVVGDFNRWDPVAMPMILDQVEGCWKATAELETGRCYRFRYLLDGNEWLNDHHADAFADRRDGSQDSVLELGGWLHD